MAFLDLVLGGLLAYGIIRGIWNGFFVELASFVSLLLGIFVAIKFSHLVTHLIAPLVSWQPQTIRIVAFVVTFIGVVISISLFARFFTSVANFAGLGVFNKILGGFFGLLKMVLIVGVSLHVFAKMNSRGAFADKETLEKSLFYNPIRKTAALVYPSIAGWFSKTTV